MNPIAVDRPDETVRRQVARATLQLRRYRLSRDRVRQQRLKDLPWLAKAIAEALAGTGNSSSLKS